MSDQSDECEPYHVGYRRPPREHQFKKGRSGNPKGRPKGPKSLNRLFDEAMVRKLTVVEQGERRSITLAEALVAKLLASALGGTVREKLLVLEAIRIATGDRGDDGGPSAVTIAFRETK